jgi:hypothetical protein
MVKIIKTSHLNKNILLFCMLALCFFVAAAHEKPKFRVLAFYTGVNDQAHISYVEEANRWFPEMAKKNNFEYEATTDWSKLNTAYLANYQVVLFLDTRPEDPAQREAFQKYMDAGGAWMGFHFAAFAMNDTSFPQDWNWYQNTFLGCGEYVNNTWRPTSAVLRVEQKHPATRNIPVTFASAPNEWYRWKNDLKANADIEVLVAIDPASFPLGTGPKLHEIWHEGYYPVVWTNKKYKMLYINMGHNDIDYEGGTNKTLSYTFANAAQSQMILDALLWLGSKQ